MHSLFSVDRVPFSTFGSWISISIPKREEELYFRNHHGGANNLFPLRTLADGEGEAPVADGGITLSVGTGEALRICAAQQASTGIRSS